MQLSHYSATEERWNTITHVFATMVSVAAGVVLLYKGYYDAIDSYLWLAYLLFVLCVIAGFASSSLYHGLPVGEGKKIMRLVDHLCIYLVIAGSYTPFTVGNLRYDWGVFGFILIWLIALSGISFKWAIRKKLDKYTNLDAYFYLAMGCTAILFLRPIFDHIAWGGIGLIFLGGFFYITGVYFYLATNIAYNHAIWHLFVMGGAASHYLAVFWYVHMPQLPA